MKRTTRKQWASGLHAATLLTLPLVGLGVIYSLTGRDLGAGFQPAYVFMAGACVLEFGLRGCSGMRRGLGHDLPGGRYFACAMAAIALSAFGMVLHPAPVAPEHALARYLKQWMQMLIMLSFVILTVWRVRDEQTWRAVRSLMIMGISFEVVYAALQAWHFYHPQDWFAGVERVFTSNPAILSGSRELFLEGSFRGIPRLRGTVCEPLYLGNYLLMALPLLWLPGRGHGRAWSWLGSAAGIGLLLLTWSRGAYLAAGVCAVAAIILLARARQGRLDRRWLWFGMAAMAALAVGAALFNVSEGLLLPWLRLKQSFDLQDWSNLTRWYSLQVGARAFALSPWWGIGWGQFGFHFPALVDPMGLQSQFSWPVVNNFPLQILCETGLMGFAVFFFAAGSLICKVWRAVAPESAHGRRLGAAGRRRVIVTAVAVVGVWSQLLTFSQYNLPHIWVSLGLLLAALQGARGPVDEASDGRDIDQEMSAHGQ